MTCNTHSRAFFGKSTCGMARSAKSGCHSTTAEGVSIDAPRGTRIEASLNYHARRTETFVTLRLSVGTFEITRALQTQEFHNLQNFIKISPSNY